MTFEFVLGFGRQALETMLTVSLPILLVSLVIGLVVSVFQSITQIQEMTISVVPKIVLTFVSLLVFGPWMMGKMTDLLRDVIVNLPNWAR